MINSIRTSSALISALILSVVGGTVAEANTVTHYNSPVSVMAFSAVTGMDLDKDAQTDFFMNLVPFDYALYSSGLSGFEVSQSGGYVALYGADFSVDSSLSYASSAAIDPAAWLNSGGGFFAYRFQHQAISTYGWARVVMDGFNANITEWAFETSGSSIQTGASVSEVPEPASCAAIAGLATLGLAATRRRRRLV